MEGHRTAGCSSSQSLGDPRGSSHGEVVRARRSSHGCRREGAVPAGKDKSFCGEGRRCRAATLTGLMMRRDISHYFARGTSATGHEGGLRGSTHSASMGDRQRDTCNRRRADSDDDFCLEPLSRCRLLVQSDAVDGHSAANDGLRASGCRRQSGGDPLILKDERETRKLERAEELSSQDRSVGCGCEDIPMSSNVVPSASTRPGCSTPLCHRTGIPASRRMTESSEALKKGGDCHPVVVWIARALRVAFCLLVLLLPYTVGLVTFLGFDVLSVWPSSVISQQMAVTWRGEESRGAKEGSLAIAFADNPASSESSDDRDFALDPWGAPVGERSRQAEVFTNALRGVVERHSYQSLDALKQEGSPFLTGSAAATDTPGDVVRWAPRRLLHAFILEGTAPPVFSRSVLPAKDGLSNAKTLERMLIALLENKLDSLTFREEEDNDGEALEQGVPKNSKASQQQKGDESQSKPTTIGGGDKGSGASQTISGSAYEELAKLPDKLSRQLVLALIYGTELPRQLDQLSCSSRLSRFVKMLRRHRRNSNPAFDQWRILLEKYRFTDQVVRGASLVMRKYPTSYYQDPQLDAQGRHVCFDRMVEAEVAEDEDFRLAVKFLIKHSQPFHRFGMFHHITTMAVRAMATPYLMRTMSQADLMQEFSFASKIAFLNFTLLQSLSSTVTIQLDPRPHGVVLVLELQCLPKSLKIQCDVRDIENQTLTEASKTLSQFRRRLELLVHEKILKGVDRYENYTYGVGALQSPDIELPKVQIIGGYIKELKTTRDQVYNNFGHLLPRDTYEHLKKKARKNFLLLQTVVRDSSGSVSSNGAMEHFTEFDNPWSRGVASEPRFKKSLSAMQASQLFLKEVSFDPFLGGTRISRVLHTSINDLDYTLSTPVTFGKGEEDPDHVIIFRGPKKQISKGRELLKTEFMNVLTQPGMNGSKRLRTFAESRMIIDGTALLAASGIIRTYYFGRHLDVSVVSEVEASLTPNCDLVQVTIVGLGDMSKMSPLKNLTSGEVANRLMNWSLTSGIYETIHNSSYIPQHRTTRPIIEPSPELYPLWVVVLAVVSPTMLFAILFIVLWRTKCLRLKLCCLSSPEESSPSPGMPSSAAPSQSGSAERPSFSSVLPRHTEEAQQQSFDATNHMTNNSVAGSGKPTTLSSLWTTFRRHSINQSEYGRDIFSGSNTTSNGSEHPQGEALHFSVAASSQTRSKSRRGSIRTDSRLASVMDRANVEPIAVAPVTVPKTSSRGLWEIAREREIMNQLGFHQPKQLGRR